MRNIEAEVNYDKKKEKSVYRTDTKNEEDTKYKVPKRGLDDCFSFDDIPVPSDDEDDKDGLYYYENKMIQTTENIPCISVKIELHMAVMCIKKIMCGRNAWASLRDDGCSILWNMGWVRKSLKTYYADAYICRKCLGRCNHINILNIL